MNIKHLISIATLSLSSTIAITAQADTLSFTAGAGIWNTSPSGDIREETDTVPVDVKDDLVWDDESQGYVFAILEHPVPILPNVKLVATSIDQSGNNKNADFVYDGKQFKGNVTNDFSLETIDLIGYYEVLDNIVSLDIGLNVRNLSIDYQIITTPFGNSFKDSIDETIPMLYAMIGASPLPDLIISGELSYISYSGSSISDFTARVAYTTDFFIGVEAGYRKQRYKFDEDTVADISFDGLFAGAYLKF
jgi:outer membrane protein